MPDTCPRCGRPTEAGWCGRCFAWAQQPAGDPPRPAVRARPRVVEVAAEVARQATGRDDGPAHDAVAGVVAAALVAEEATVRCRSCGAPIRWAKTRQGKAMPLDANPTPTGNVVISPDGAARVLTRKQVEQGGIVGDRYVSHHATCPQAKQWRRE